MVVVPGVEGDFGALPQHAPFIPTLRPGIIAVFENNQVTDRLFVAGGFAEVTPERCTVLAERALPAIGRAHVWTPVTNAHLVCHLLPEKTKAKTSRHDKT